MGIYDIRVEAEGLVTEMKHGVRILEGQATTIDVIVRPGKGVHIVEYATGGLPREEVAARLSAVEATLAKLQQESTGIAVSPADQTSEARTTGTVKWFDAPRVVVTAIDAKAGIVTALDPATKRSFQFSGTSTVVTRLTVGQKVWANFDTQKVSVDGAEACCTMVGTVARP